MVSSSKNMTDKKRLADALAHGLIFGLNRSGTLATIDPMQGLDGIDRTWWKNQRWTEQQKESFKVFLIRALGDAAYQVVLGEAGVIDRHNKIAGLDKLARAKWYRENCFNFPLQEAWPAEGLRIRDAVQMGQPLEPEITDEMIDVLAGEFRGHLFTGFFVASGQKERGKGKRIMIPTSEFEMLDLSGWRDDVIHDGYSGLVYWEARIHSPDNLPREFLTNYEKQKLALAKAQHKADPILSKDGWGYMDWLRATAADRFLFPQGASGTTTNPAQLGRKSFLNYQSWREIRKPAAADLSTIHPLQEHDFKKHASAYLRQHG